MIKIDISLLICVHIETKLSKLKITMDSIFNQSHTPNEIIIIINGPLSDNLLKFTYDFINSNENILRIPLKKNEGLATALNKGLSASSNELIGRIDPGDIIIDDRFIHQKNFLDSNPHISVCGSFAYEIYNKKKRILKKPIIHEEIINSLKIKNPIIHSTVVYRKSHIEKVGNYPIINKCQDYFLWIKCYEYGLKFHNLPVTLIETELDKEMMNRRNFSYFLNERKIYSYMYNKNLIGLFNYIFLIITRLSLRIIPNYLKMKLYNLR